jgi:hypothetical protein
MNKILLKVAVMKKYLLLVIFPMLLGHSSIVYAEYHFEGECITADRKGHRAIYDNYIIKNNCNKLVSIARKNSKYYIEPNTTQKLPFNGSHSGPSHKKSHKITEHVEASKKLRGHAYRLGQRVFTGICLDVFYTGVHRRITANNDVPVTQDKYDVYNQCAQEVILSKSGNTNKIPKKKKRLSPAFGYYAVPYRDNTPSSEHFYRGYFVTLNGATRNNQPFTEKLTKKITAKLYKRSPYPPRAQSQVKKSKPSKVQTKKIAHQQVETEVTQVNDQKQFRKTVSNAPQKGQTEAEWWGSDDDWDKKW